MLDKDVKEVTDRVPAVPVPAVKTWMCDLWAPLALGSDEKPVFLFWRAHNEIT